MTQAITIYLHKARKIVNCSNIALLRTYPTKSVFHYFVWVEGKPCDGLVPVQGVKIHQPCFLSTIPFLKLRKPRVHNS